MSTETEFKLYVADLDTVRQRLDSVGALLAAPRVFERNIRYENAAESFTPNGIVLRLRQDARARLTYKDPGTLVGDAISRYEAEVEVSDFDIMHDILLRLGFHVSMIYEKYRTTYTLSDAEVVLDELPYGSFVEIEGPSSAIEAVRRHLDLTHAPAMQNSYTGLFEQLRQRLGFTFRDLTFDNFHAITVPDDIFIG